MPHENTLDINDKDRIIVFDGLCVLCNSSVDLLIKLDKCRLFKYASLQGEYVKTLNLNDSIQSIVYLENGQVYYKSTAILKILRSLGGIWAYTTIFYIIPPTIRDFIYDIIAKYRYKIFGKLTTCRMPKDGESALFLD